MNIKTKLTGLKDALRVFLVRRSNWRGLGIGAINEYYPSPFLRNECDDLNKKEKLLLTICAIKYPYTLSELVAFAYDLKFKYGKSLSKYKLYVDKIIFYNCPMNAYYLEMYRQL